MLKRLQFRRGNSQAISTYVGLPGELMVNTDDHSLVVSDGTTAGGHAVPTAAAVANLAANVTTSQSDILAANLAMKGYVDAQINSIPIGVAYNDFIANINVLTANAASQSDAISNIISNTSTLGTDISNANVAMKGYVDGQVSILTANAGIQATQISSLSVNATLANLAMKGYVDSQDAVVSGLITTANTAMKGYVDTQIGSIPVGVSLADFESNVSALTSNAGIQSDQITILGTDISNANIAMKGYVDSQDTIVSGLITTANTAMKGYVDAQIGSIPVGVSIADFESNISALISNAAVQSDVLDTLTIDNGNQATQITILGTDISNANVAMKGYVDSQVSGLVANAATQSDAIDLLIANAGVQHDAIVILGTDISNANVAMKGYVDSQDTIVSGLITTANTAMKGYVDSQDTIVSGLITTANTAMKGYVDEQITTLTSNAATQSDAIDLLIANAGVQHDAIVILGTDISNANVLMKGYVDGQVSILTANAGAQSDQITILGTDIANANVAMKGYVDSQDTIVSGLITTANTALKGYVDEQITTLTSNAAAQSDAIDLLIANAGAQSDQITILGTDISNANVAMKGYVDSEIAAIPTYSNANVASYLPTYSGSFGGTAASVVNGVYTTDTGTVTNTMLANSSITINGNAVSLGGTITISSGSGSAITVKDEGVDLTTALTSLDFVGAGVTATNIDGNVTVTISASGAGTAGRHAMFIGAGGMSPTVTAGCASLAKLATGANQPDLMTLDFDPTTQEYAQFSVVMPKKWDEGTVTFIPHWSHASTTTNFGVVWGLQAVAVSNADSIAATYGTAQTSTSTGGTTNTLYNGTESAAITIAGTPAAEDMVFFRFYRDPAAGADTLAIDARLHGITMYVTTAAETDA